MTLDDPLQSAGPVGRAQSAGKEKLPGSQEDFRKSVADQLLSRTMNSRYKHPGLRMKTKVLEF